MSYPVRVECTFEDLADTWIEVPDRGWTLAKMDEILNGRFQPADVVALVRRHVTACNIQVQPDPEAPEAAGAGPAGPITSPADLTEEILRYHMDVRMINFLVSAIHRGARNTFEQAPLAVRVSSVHSGAPKLNPPS